MRDRWTGKTRKPWERDETPEELERRLSYVTPKRAIQARLNADARAQALAVDADQLSAKPPLPEQTGCHAEFCTVPAGAKCYLPAQRCGR